MLIKDFGHVLFSFYQAKKQMMQQLEHERNLKLGAFERVEELQRQVRGQTMVVSGRVQLSTLRLSDSQKVHRLGSCHSF